MSILEVNNVSIRYMTGDFKDIGLKEYVMRKLKNDYHVTEFWADRDICFKLEKGDMLGIIGSNGAGKSTLLKAITGIMEPTKGNVKRHGSVAALLELASGFDGELTVKENAYLRGAMLGYTRSFMDETYEQIIHFAELEEFQDRPFKHLSSGMKSRLAFSIASLVQPDILILDEVLSVGDGAFRKKSEGKMQEIINGGATTILVSHSVDQIRRLCNKVLWLDHGRQIEFGEDVDGICDRYEAFLRGDFMLPEQSQLSNDPQKNREESTISSYKQSPKKSKSTYNAEIDIFRLFFALIICIYHSYTFANGSTIFKRGYVAVEYYFILSGYFMAAKIRSCGEPNYQIPTADFILHKLKGFYKPFISSLIIGFIGREYLAGDKIIIVIRNLFLGLYEAIFARQLGIIVVKTHNGPSWYISAMVIGMVLLYPLAKKYQRPFYKVACPMLALFCYGQLVLANETLNQAETLILGGYIMGGLVRAIAGLCVGMFINECCQILIEMGIKPTRFGKCFFLLLELGALFCIIFYAQYADGMKWIKKADFGVVLIEALFCFIICSELTGINCFLSKINVNFKVMSTLSLYLYLSHRVVTYYLIEFFSDITYQKQLLVYLILTICSMTACRGIVFLIDFISGHYIQKIKKLLFTCE